MDNRQKTRTGQSLPKCHLHRFSTKKLVVRNRLEEVKRKLGAQKLRAIAAFAGGFAHDFNNILAAISGFTELALDDIPTDSPARENLLETMAGVKKARHLVDQIHAIGSRNRRGFCRVSLASLLHESLCKLRADLPSNVEIQTDFLKDGSTEGQEFFISANPDDVHLLIRHLVENASEALLPSGGRIAVHLGRIHGEKLELSISDNGQGMTSSVCERLFEPFFTTRKNSRGLGLAICHGIVEKHKGTILVESNLGNGTCITMNFPIDSELQIQVQGQTNKK